MNGERVIIFDGRNLLWRAHSVFRTLSVTLPDGEVIPTGGMYGFLSLAALKWRKFGGRAIVAWEGSSNYRYDVYPAYKAKDSKEKDPFRQELANEIDLQEIRLKSVLRAMGVEQYKAIGGEADDVLATLAATHVKAKKGNKAVIYTGDSDLRQMVGDGITVVAPGNKNKDTLYSTDLDVITKESTLPMLLPDMKALAGDSSDNIPGVVGVGKAFGEKLLVRYGSLEKTIEAASLADADWPIAKRFQSVIESEADQLRLYKRLATVMQDCEMKLLKPKRDKLRVLGYLRMYRFASLLAPLDMSSLMKMGTDE